jgi:hypothetical protein
MLPLADMTAKEVRRRFAKVSKELGPASGIANVVLHKPEVFVIGVGPEELPIHNVQIARNHLIAEGLWKPPLQF